MALPIFLALNVTEPLGSIHNELVPLDKTDAFEEEIFTLPVTSLPLTYIVTFEPTVTLRLLAPNEKLAAFT